MVRFYQNADFLQEGGRQYPAGAYDDGLIRDRDHRALLFDRHVFNPDFLHVRFQHHLEFSAGFRCLQILPVFLFDPAEALTAVGDVPLVGLDYKDTDADGAAVLAQAGNPYQVIATDVDGRVGIDYGVYGVPETYVIDKAGIIRYKQIGPLTEEALRDNIMPLIKGLK